MDEYALDLLGMSLSRANVQIASLKSKLKVDPWPSYHDVASCVPLQRLDSVCSKQDLAEHVELKVSPW